MRIGWRQVLEPHRLAVLVGEVLRAQGLGRDVRVVRPGLCRGRRSGRIVGTWCRGSSRSVPPNLSDPSPRRGDMSRRDPQAFADFVAARSAALHRAAYLMVGDAQLAQDLAAGGADQDVRRVAAAAGPEQGRGLHPQGDHDDGDHLVSRKKPGASGPIDTVPERELRPATRTPSRPARPGCGRRCRSCPLRQRAAIVLRYYEDLTEAQTADAMGCAVGTVKSQVSAGLRKLRDAPGDRHRRRRPAPPDLIEVTR